MTDRSVAASRPSSTTVVVFIVTILAVALAIGAVVSPGGDEAEPAAATTSTPTSTTEPNPFAASVSFSDGSSASIDRREVEFLTGLILGHEQFLVMSFADPNETRVRTRVTRNLIVSEIVKHASPEPVPEPLFALIRDQQVIQVEFKLIEGDFDVEGTSTRAREIMREMTPYVDLLADTLARSGSLPSLVKLVEPVTVIVDSSIGKWDAELIDVINISVRG